MGGPYVPVFAIALLGLLGPTVAAASSERGCVGMRARPELICLVQVASPAPTSVWRFSRIRGPKEGESFAAITKTAETMQSDPDFAGLIVRCAPHGKIDVLVALIRPFPPKSHPKVTLSSATGGTLTFEASMAAAGAAVLLPDEVSAFAAGKWQTTPSLSVVVKESDSEIKGMVGLNGLREAYHSLLTNCGQ
jgi:hypothetical protein